MKEARRRWRPLAGWVLAGAGVVAIIAGWVGVSGTPLVARQLPYLVSGGIAGLALVVLGGMLLAADDLRATAERLEQVEAKVSDLHRLLLRAADAVGDEPLPAPPVREEGLVALPGGRSLHRPSCPVVAGKGGVRAVTAGEVARLQPCKLCEPGPAGTPAAAPAPG